MAGVWIGLHATITDKSFTTECICDYNRTVNSEFFSWTDGSPVDYTKWGTGIESIEPDGCGYQGII